MVDFDGLLNGPIMDAFGQPVGFIAIKSGDTLEAVERRGDFRREHVEEEGFDNDLSTLRAWLGIRLSEYPTEPLQGDEFDIQVDGSTVRYVVDDVQKDAVGEAKLILRVKHNG